MTEWIKRILESKRAYRAKLVAQPFEEKVRMLGKLRQRALAIQAAKGRQARR